MRIHLTAAFLLFSFFTEAQFATNDSRWGISLGPAIVSMPANCYAIQPGVEYKISKRFYLLGEVAIPVGRRFNGDSIINSKYLRLRAEIRYFFARGPKGITEVFLPKEIKFNKYVALQTSYAFRSFRDIDGGIHFINDESDPVISFDKASIRSSVFTASLQFGAVYELTRNFYIDGFMGIGTRIIHTHYSDVGNPHLVSYTPSKSSMPPKAYLYEGNVIRLHGNAGFRFLYRF